MPDDFFPNTDGKAEAIDLDLNRERTGRNLEPGGGGLFMLRDDGEWLHTFRARPGCNPERHREENG